MPGVNGYRGDPYPGGGGQYPGPSRSDGYDPYSGHRNPSAAREDPYNYGRPPTRDPYPGREDPYSSRVAGPVEDPYSRQKKTEDPYSYRKVEDPYSHRKPEDPYSHRKPDDPYYYQRRTDEEPYARVHKDRHRNGAGLVEARDDYRPRAHEPDGATSPFPHYDLDHLATFKVEARHGVMSPMDGIRKLRHMELSSGIWTMRITLVIEPQDLIVIDRASGEDMERFPVSAVSQPTAVTNDDRRDVYNNIVLFTVTEESRKGPQSEMHLFQCIGRPAHEVVDDIKAAKAGKIRGPVPTRDHDHGGVSNKIRDFEQHAQRNYIATQGYHQEIPSSQLLRQSMHRDDNESVLSDHTDQEVQLLNHCFDDIEKFIGRLQSAAEAYRELDNRRKQRVNKRSKHPIGEGMLSMRSRPPPAADFIDVFQKFKLSFNLLARLKPHIHDPNAPELVHFLFTPLSLVVEASKDPRHGTPDIASRVVSPMLTPEAKELLLNCLSSKETSLWNSLGEAWTLSRDEYRGHVPPYNPRFSDGWEPPRSWNVDASYVDSMRYQDNESSYRRGASHAHPDPYVGDPYSSRSPVPNSDVHKRALEEYEQEYRRRAERRLEAERQREDELARDNRRYEVESERDYPQQSSTAVKAPLTFEEEQEEFVQQLREKNAKVAEAIHPRQGKNAKELTLQKGEFVEVIDSSRNWWKVRNAKGDTGHAPYTILRELPAQRSAVRH